MASGSQKDPTTISVRGRGGRQIAIPSNMITDKTRWVFQNGQCFSLAITIAEKLGSDVGLLVRAVRAPWGIRYNDPILNLPYDWFKCTLHAVALTNFGGMGAISVGIDGVVDLGSLRDEFIKTLPEYMSATMIVAPPEWVRQRLVKSGSASTGFLKPDYEAAEIVFNLMKLDSEFAPLLSNQPSYPSCLGSGLV